VEVVEKKVHLADSLAYQSKKEVSDGPSERIMLEYGVP